MPNMSLRVPIYEAADNMKNPWNYHSDLLQERLVYSSALLIRARRETLDLYDEAGGDTPWGLGCRAYDRTRTLLIRESERVPWLTIIDPSLHLIFGIGSVPVRFYRGPAETPKTNTLGCSYPELKQLQLAFGDDQPDLLLWRFAIETNVLGDVSNITFIGTDETGNIHCSWVMPDTEIEIALPRVETQFKSSGIELPAPKVGLPGTAKKDNKENDH
jgi:hypothetical protein